MTAAVEGSAGDWTTALSVLAAHVDELERRLDGDMWDDHTDLLAIDPDGPLPATLVPTARRLADRLAVIEQRMTAELAAARDELHELTLRRRAARGYQRT